MYTYKKSNSTCVSARDVAVILDDCPFQKRDELLLEKCDYRRKKPFTDSMKRGIELEPEAISKLCEFLKIDPNEVQRPGFKRHKHFPVGGVPDGIYKDILIEIKCPNRFTIGNKPPSFYISQIQVYMQIFDINEGIYVEYIRDQGLNIIHIERSNIWWEWVTPLIKSFWNEVEFWRNNNIQKYMKLKRISFYETEYKETKSDFSLFTDSVSAI